MHRFIWQANFLANKGEFVLIAKALDIHMCENSKNPALRTETQDSIDADETLKIINSGAITADNAMALMRRGFYIFGYDLALRGFSEHVELKFSCFTLVERKDGSKKLMFKPPPHKAGKGGLKKPMRENDYKDVALFERLDIPALCPVKCYLDIKALRDAAEAGGKVLPDRVYMGCQRQKVGGVWVMLNAFTCQPLGKHSIANLPPSICEIAGITRRTGHCIRASAATDCQAANLPDAVGMKITRHAQVGTYARYNHPSEDQQEVVTGKRRAAQLGLPYAEGTPPAAKKVALSGDRVAFKDVTNVAAPATFGAPAVPEPSAAGCGDPLVIMKELISAQSVAMAQQLATAFQTLMGIKD